MRNRVFQHPVREQAFVHGLSPQSIYFRLHGTIKDLSKKDLEKFANPDSRNAVALIVLCIGETSEEKSGVARYVIDPDEVSREFATVVTDTWQRRGVGT